MLPVSHRLRLASAALVASACLFVALIAASMSIYPGGTHWNPNAPGHDFWRNYLCDLARAVALNGRPNPLGSAIAQAAMSVLGLGLIPLFWLLPSSFPSRRALGAWVRRLGGVAGVAAIGVGLMPSDLFGGLHDAAIVAGGVFGLAAAAIAVVGLLLEHDADPALVGLGVAAVVVATVDFTLYVRALAGDDPGVIVAVLERISVMFVLAWMARTALAFARVSANRSDAARPTGPAGASTSRPC